jgi:hypothetical protein
VPAPFVALTIFGSDFLFRNPLSVVPFDRAFARNNRSALEQARVSQAPFDFDLGVPAIASSIFVKPAKARQGGAGGVDCRRAHADPTGPRGRKIFLV